MADSRGHRERRACRLRILACILLAGLILAPLSWWASSRYLGPDRHFRTVDLMLTTMQTHEDAGTRAYAGRQIGYASRSQREEVLAKAMPTLIDAAIKDKDQHVRHVARWALWYCGDPLTGKSVRKLLTIVATGSPEARKRAMQAVVEVAPRTDSGCLALADAVDDKDPGIREAATEAMKKVKASVGGESFTKVIQKLKKQPK